MPPKSTKKNTISTEDEQGLQAIVLTDSFQTRFMPLTSVKPRCLLPLANVPLIEYTLEFLAQAEIGEVYLMCCAHADQIQEYIDNSKWVLASSPFKKIQAVMSLESRSVGDAMRDIDSRGIINGDFILVSGDVVTNIDLSKAINVHKQHRANDKEHIATMVLKEASQLHRSRSQIEPACFLLDKDTNKCLFYQDIPPINGTKTDVNIDPELLEGVDEFILRNDLIDCHVDICSPHVPTIFQENFDYQLLRTDFVRGVLSSDLLKKSIYAYITKEDYAARVESWQTFDGISQDVLERWCYPIVPDRNMLRDQTYSYGSKHIYKEQNVRLSQSCELVSRVVIGSGTFVGDGSSIIGSVLGRDCHIGKNVIIENSYIWNGAVIEDGSIVKHSIVASDAIVRKNAVISPGSVIGFNVIIDENVIIPNNTKIVKEPIKKLADSIIDLNSSFGSDSEDEEEDGDDDDDDDDDEEDEDEEDEEDEYKEPVKINDPSVVGLNGVGFLYESDNEDDDDSHSRYSGIVYEMERLNFSDVSIASTTILHQNRRKKKRSQSSASMNYTDDDEGSDEEEENFDVEAIATVERAMENNHDIDTALLELNTLRMSMNVTYHEVRLSTCTALLKRVSHFIDTQTLGVKEAADKIFKKWGLLFKRQVFDEEDQIDLLLILQKICSNMGNNYSSMIFLHILIILYDEEIIEEDSIYQWWDSEECKEMDQVRDKASKWIEWLKEAESGSEEESEEEE